MMRIYDGFDFFAKKLNNKIIIQFGKESLTFAEFKKNTDDIAYYLKEKNTYKSKIIIKTDSPIKGLLLLVGAAKAALKSILIDSDYPQKFIDEIMIKEDIKEIINVDEVIRKAKRASFLHNTLENPKAEDVFIGILSSGSTGNPKVVWRDHASWAKGFESQNKIFKIGKKDIFFIGGSIVYSANLNMALHVINQGGTIIFSEKNLPRSWIKVIEDKRVTGIFLVPAYYRILVKNIKKKLDNVSLLISAGEKMDITTLKSIKETFPNSKFLEYYGASELGHITYATMDDLILKPESVGKKFPGVKLKIIKGKIWVKSPFAAPLYRPWGSVKDIGYIDEEGFLFLQGREGRIINKGGVKILPGDLEKIIRTFPGVKEVVVIGVGDYLKGEIPVAFIEEGEKIIKPEEIVEFLKGKVLKSVIPKRFIFIKNIPRNNFGKIHFKLLKNMI